ncbi:MAG TPA: glycosyltransferase family 2 protein [Thermoanaerobaculaceae bacterium]|nr:glycosyltransferase family 2 protein [Thermoanaerobaculaceae bacterium]
MVTGRFDRSVSMVAWAYNEEALISGFLERALAALDDAVGDYELILVDDGSTDRTNEIAQTLARRNPRLRVVTNERNMNIGPSFKRAVAAARKEFVFWQTVDWSYDLSHLRLFLELLKHFDVVVGVRPVPIRLLSYIPVIRSIYRVRTRSDNLRKAIVSLGNYYLIRILYKMDFHDFQNIQFYPTALAQSFSLEGESSFLAPEMLARAMARGCRFLEVPIHFIPRSGGEAKGTKLRSIVRSVRDIWRNWVRWGWRFRLSRRGRAPGQICRVSEPFFLEEDVLRLVIPLFKSFRSRAAPTATPSPTL